MATIVYALCALTSVTCAILLLRGYRESRAPLLFWAAICFGGLALNNILLFIDLQIVPTTDLSVWRSIPAALGVSAFLYGLVMEVR
jgi:hypothetical protein